MLFSLHPLKFINTTITNNHHIYISTDSVVMEVLSAVPDELFSDSIATVLGAENINPTTEVAVSDSTPIFLPPSPKLLAYAD